MASRNRLSLLCVLVLLQCAQGVITSIRLMTNTTDTTATGNGRVEVLYSGTWVSICDDFWDDNEAGAVCRMLGITNGTNIAVRRQEAYGIGPLPLTLQVDCTSSTASSLNSCTLTSITLGSCGTEQAAVECRSVSSTATPSGPNCPSWLRLAANPGAYRGTGIVEIQNPTTSAWGTICDDRWDVLDATVICRMCNYHLSVGFYPRPGAQGSDISGASSLPIHLDDVECLGTELDVRNCVHAPWNVHDCNDWEKASVSCIQFNSSAKPPPRPDIDCSNNYMLVSFSRSYDPNLQPRHLTVNPPSGCTNAIIVANGSHVNVQIPIRSCNMNLTQNATHIIYQNVIRYDYTNVTGFITYVNDYDIYVRCEMNRTANLTRIYEPLREVASVSAAGGYNFTMKFFLNDSFTNEDPRQPLPIAIGEKLNVGINLEGNHNDLELIVHNCWTTPVPPSISTVAQNIMINNCRVESTLRTFPLNHTTFGFRFQTYKFTTSNLIYVNCDAYACIRYINTQECDQTCSNPKPAGRRKRDTSSSPQRFLLTSPPVYVFVPGQEGDLSEHVKPETPKVTTGPPIVTTTHKQQEAAVAAALADSRHPVQSQTLLLAPYSGAAQDARPPEAVLLGLLALLAWSLGP